jgi:hypothetical protein
MMNKLQNPMMQKKDPREEKAEIVDTLLGINGSMKEFSQDLQFRLGKAFKSKAGKLYGMNNAQMSNYTKNTAFGNGNYDAVTKQAKQFLRNYQK